MTHEPAVEFALGLSYNDIPEDVRSVARRCLLDLTGVAIAGSRTPLSKIVRDHAASHFGASNLSASLFLDGRQVSPVGAALAGGMTIDSIDAHDGHRLTKGHAGCGVLPALIALSEAHGIDEESEFVAMLVIGYELATRAGIALHETVPDYHTSGAWVALACAALGARAMRMDEHHCREAMGIAEYHGPRSQMMRAIDHPTMVKDGSGWGSMAGLSAAYLAADGFTGAPALTVEDGDVAHLWSDLGERWRIREQYFKAYPVCRWAQPPVEAVLQLLRDHTVDIGQIDHLEVSSFHEAIRLATPRPTTTEEAQYSLPWAIAAAAVRGKIGVEEITESAFIDPEIVRLAGSVVMTEEEGFNRLFPERRFARVTMVLSDGSRIISSDTEAMGDPEAPMTDAQLIPKFRSLSEPVVGEGRAAELIDLIQTVGTGQRTQDYVRMMTAPIEAPR